MMIVALWKFEVIAYQILEEGMTVDSITYLNFLEHLLLPEVTRKKFGRPIILHDNARPHKHRIVREFLEEKRWEELDHPPIALICRPGHAWYSSYKSSTQGKGVPNKR